LSRDFRLKATELYLKITKEEFDFQKERLEQLVEDFPQDRDVLPLTQVIIDVDDVGPFDNETDVEEDVFTQRPLPQRQNRMVNHKGSALFIKYIEIALKTALLQTEREIHFLVERGVKETPFVIEEARDLNRVLRKDFVLQA
jgi:hypothetical protein